MNNDNKKPRQRGRPAKVGNLADNILNAAERLFAEASYDSVSQREIASEASVDQALINYHFGSKEGLYTAVVDRYGSEIVKKWEENLKKIEGRPEEPTVEDFLRAYIGPFFAYRRQPGLHVLKLQARLHAETKPMFLGVRRAIFDETTSKYIKRLIDTIPDADPADVSWRFIFTIGAFLFVGPGTDRLDDLSGGVYRVDNPEEAVDRLLSFLVAGFLAPSTYASNARSSVTTRARRRR